MSDETQSEESGSEMVVELPPALVQFLHLLQADQKKLMKDKSFANGDQLRKFVATTLMERFVQAVEMLGTTMYDLHQLGSSNAIQLQRQRRWTAKHLRKLGAEVSDGEAFPGVGTDQINLAGEAFFALGSYLQTKYSHDKDLEARFNAFASAYNQLIEALMGDQQVEDDEDEEDEDEDEDDEAETEEPSVGDEPAGGAEPSGGEAGDGGENA